MDCFSWGMHGFGFGFMWLLPILFIGFLILLFVRRPGRLARGSGPGESAETVRNILDRRYASGEITREQYEQMKKDIDLK